MRSERTTKRLSLAFAMTGCLGVGAIGAACSSSNGAGSGSGSGSDSGLGTADAGGGGGDAGGDAAEDAGPPQAYLRIANLSPDAIPVDVCISLNGTGPFQGPLFEQLALALAGDGGGIGSDAGGLPAVAYGQVSAYIPVPPGQYSLRILPGGATSCAIGLERPHAPSLAVGDAGADASDDAGADEDASALDASVDASLDASSGSLDASSLDGGLVDSDGGAKGLPVLPSLVDGEHATLLLAGDVVVTGSDKGQRVALLPDDDTLASGGAALRAVNAVPSEPALDFGLQDGNDWLSFVTDVVFGAASSQPAPGASAPDGNGYTVIAPLGAGQAMSARASASGSDAGAAVASSSSVEVDLGSIATVFAIGGKTGDTAHPPALLVCTDNQPSGGLLSDCSVAP